MEQKSRENETAVWFDAECHLARQRKKQVVHKMRNRVALLRRQGNFNNAEETQNAIRGVQNAYTNFVRGKKAIYIKGLEEKGDVGFICQLTLNKLVESVCSREKQEEKQARIQRAQEKLELHRMNKMKKEMEEHALKAKEIMLAERGLVERGLLNGLLTSNKDHNSTEANNEVKNATNVSSSDSSSDSSDSDDDKYEGKGGWSRWRKEIQSEPNTNKSSHEAQQRPPSAQRRPSQPVQQKSKQAAPRRKSRWEG